MLCISVDVSKDYSQVESVIKQVRLFCLPIYKNPFANYSVSIYSVLFIVLRHKLFRWFSLVADCWVFLFDVQAQEKLGPVDMLVNCAGTSISGKFEEVEVDRFKVRAAYHRHSSGHFFFILINLI